NLAGLGSYARFAGPSHRYVLPTSRRYPAGTAYYWRYSTPEHRHAYGQLGRSHARHSFTIPSTRHCRYGIDCYRGHHSLYLSLQRGSASTWRQQRGSSGTGKPGLYADGAFRTTVDWLPSRTHRQLHACLWLNTVLWHYSDHCLVSGRASGEARNNLVISTLFMLLSPLLERLPCRSENLLALLL